MRAVDTNILARILLRDNEEQSALAFRVLREGPVFVATTVMLETECLLRSVYRLPHDEIVRLLRDLGGLTEIILEHPQRIATALEWTEAGMDFADALHLASSQHCEGFVTFDRSLVRGAAALESIPVAEPSDTSHPGLMQDAEPWKD